MAQAVQPRADCSARPAHNCCDHALSLYVIDVGASYCLLKQQNTFLVLAAALPLAVLTAVFVVVAFVRAKETKVFKTYFLVDTSTSSCGGDQTRSERRRSTYRGSPHSKARSESERTLTSSLAVLLSRVTVASAVGVRVVLRRTASAATAFVSSTDMLEASAGSTFLMGASCTHEIGGGGQGAVRGLLLCINTKQSEKALQARTLGLASVGDWGTVIGAALRQKENRGFVVLFVGTMAEEGDLLADKTFE